MAPRKLKAAVVGATGVAGQQFLVALENHPLFEVTRLAASSRSAGKKYIDAIRTEAGQIQWHCSEPLPAEFAGIRVDEAATMPLAGLDVVFSALESDAAKQLEPKYAAVAGVFSTASAFRYEPDVPILIPGVNHEHIRMIDVQRRKRGWKGFVLPGPNCTVTGLAITLKPLHDTFGLKSIMLTTMQSVSGAGRSPGVLALDITDNIIPYISKEEEKVEKEAQKILGDVKAGKFVPIRMNVSATCTRVPVLEGHTESVFVSLGRKASVEQVKKVMRDFGKSFLKRGYHSAPEQMIIVHDDPYRPQPRLDRDNGYGMSTTVGRVREDSVLPNGIKYVLVSHNTRMGAARGAVLTAEYVHAEGYFRRK